jgi:hypothetical protein
MQLTSFLVAAQLVASKRFFHQQQLFQDTSLDLGDWIAPSTPSSQFITHSVTQKTGAGGKHNKWNVFKHSAFPRYALRTKEESKLCDPTVKQVSGETLAMRSKANSIDCWLLGC